VKAVFITPRSNDIASVISAWESLGHTSTRISFSHDAEKEDPSLLASVSRYSYADLAFYVGAVGCPGIPSIETLKEINSILPTVHLCFDGGDLLWRPMLRTYTQARCFRFQVSIDGHPDAPADLITLAPVDPRPFHGDVHRTIHCGFSGNFNRRDPRGKILVPLIERGFVELRERMCEGETLAGYDEHVFFTRRCELLINTSFAGSGFVNHVKQRVVECGFAGCALLEDSLSPIHLWFPPESYFSYTTWEDAREKIRVLGKREIKAKAEELSKHVRADHTPEKVYGKILAKL